MELPDGARATPGYGPGQFIVRFPNNYGASLISDLHGHGVEVGIIRFPDESDEWEFVRGTSLSPYDAIVPGIDSPEALLSCLVEIASWDRPREEFTEGELRFVWTSGVYIDIYWADREDVGPFEVINIYDYAAGRCEITTRDEFIAKCRTWRRESEWESEADNYRRHTLPPYK